MATYRKADPDATDIVVSILGQHYPKLAAAGVRIGVLMAFAPKSDKTGEPIGNAVMWAGMKAAAKIRIVSLKDRVAGLPDAQIIVDGDEWPDWDEKRRTALMHHEVEHLELRLDDEGNVQTDDAFRPKLKLKTHDFYVGGFWNIVEQYETSALESEAYIGIHKGFTQRCFPWG